MIEVLTPGLFTTVQDLGRQGFGAMGVSPSGAADSVALRIGNTLVGNAENAAALEMTLAGGAFLFAKGATVALAGSDFGARIDAHQFPLWTARDVLPGQTIRFGPSLTGARCYLCVRGGVAVEPFLGSSSTHFLSGLGGFLGRPLRKGDVLPIGPDDEEGVPCSISWTVLRRFTPRKVLRVTDGPQCDWFSAASRGAFYAGSYRVSEDSNRLGLRLAGTALHLPQTRRMITEGVALGAIQVPASGQPIVVFVEQQTAGGYPKIANVIAADLFSLGQLRPGDTIRFERVSFEHARRFIREQERVLASGELYVEDHGHEID